MSQTISRRQFLRRTGTAAAAASLAGAGPLLQGCAAGKAYDLVIVGGLVYDGLGGPPEAADIGIAGGMIKAVGRISASRGRAVIEAKGLAVAPGFIDIHDHTDLGLAGRPQGRKRGPPGRDDPHQRAVRIVALPPGRRDPRGGPEQRQNPVRRRRRLARPARASWPGWRKAGRPSTIATLSGHGSLRGAAMGFNDRPPKPEEMERMKALLAEDLAAGSFGLSTGLEYTPSGFAAAGRDHRPVPDRGRPRAASTPPICGTRATG